MHYNTARPHQGIAQRVPDGEHDAPRATVTDVDTQQIRRKPVLGGLIFGQRHLRMSGPVQAARATTDVRTAHYLSQDDMAQVEHGLSRYFGLLR